MATTKISPSEIQTQTIVGEISWAWKKGTDTATVTMLGASAHPPLRVKRAYVTLNIAADAAGTTITVKLQNNGVDMTDTLTFTQGTEAVGTFKVHALTAGQDVVAQASALTMVVAGTTTTLGSITMTIVYENT